MIKSVTTSGQGEVPNYSHKREYTMSTTAIDQRKANSQRKRWLSNLRALDEKLSLKVDEFKLLNEIVSCISQTFTFEQIHDIFRQDFDEILVYKEKEWKENYDKEFEKVVTKCSDVEFQLVSAKKDKQDLMDEITRLKKKCKGIQVKNSQNWTKPSPSDASTTSSRPSMKLTASLLAEKNRNW